MKRSAALLFVILLLAAACTVQESGKASVCFDSYTLGLEFPAALASKLSLDLIESDDTAFPLVSILYRSASSGELTQFGGFVQYRESDFDALPADEPHPVEVLRAEGLVVGHFGLFDMPFELESPEAEDLHVYMENEEAMLQTVTLKQ